MHPELIGSSRRQEEQHEKQQECFFHGSTTPNFDLEEFVLNTKRSTSFPLSDAAGVKERKRKFILVVLVPESATLGVGGGSGKRR